MPVKTTTVTGRRSVHYETFEDLLADAEHLVANEVRMVGNWSLGQVLRHLAASFAYSIDGFPFLLPAPLRFLVRLTMKKRALARPLSPGLKLPGKAGALIPVATEPALGCAMLRDAIRRLENETTRRPNPALGRLTADEWTQMHLRHAELHLSFAVLVEH